MAWYSRFLAKFGAKAHPTAESLAVISPMPRLSSDEVATALGMYQNHSEVAKAVDLVAGSAAKVDLHAYMMIGGEYSEVVGHPLIDLLRRPNATMTRYELLFLTFASLDVLGNAYWFLRGDDAGVPTEIWFLDAWKMRVVPDAQTLLKGYVYEEAGRVYHFNHAEVVHFKRPSLKDTWYGHGKFYAARHEIRTDFLMSKYQRSFFEGPAVPAGLWRLPASLSDDQFRLAKEEILARHSAGERITAVVRAGEEGETVDFVAAGLNQQDMSYLDGRKYYRQIILEAGGIPTGMLSEASTEAHARVAERRYLDNVHTHHVLFAETLTRDLLPFFGGADVLEFDDVRTGDVQQLLFKRQVMQDIATPNEMRRDLLGYEPISEKGEDNASSVDVAS